MAPPHWRAVLDHWCLVTILMFYSVPLIADWHALTQCCEHHLKESLHRQDCRHCKWDYVVGHKVLKKVFKPKKLGPWTTGPYNISCVSVNDNVTVKLRPEVIERLNIRGFIPDCEPMT